jgi:hypothetical protein
MNEFLYTAIYDILSSNRDSSFKFSGLKSLKDELCRLHADNHTSMALDLGAEDRYGEEEPSLFHLIRATKRRTERTIRPIRDLRRRDVEYHNRHLTTFSGILHHKVRCNTH